MLINGSNTISLNNPNAWAEMIRLERPYFNIKYVEDFMSPQK